jgi:hypothetical protein
MTVAAPRRAAWATEAVRLVAASAYPDLSIGWPRGQAIDQRANQPVLLNSLGEHAHKAPLAE